MHTARGPSPKHVSNITASEHYCETHLNDITVISGSAYIDMWTARHLLGDVNIRSKAISCIEGRHFGLLYLVTATAPISTSTMDIDEYGKFTAIWSTSRSHYETTIKLGSDITYTKAASRETLSSNHHPAHVEHELHHLFTPLERSSRQHISATSDSILLHIRARHLHAASARILALSLDHLSAWLRHLGWS